MASAKLAHPSFPATASPRLRPSLHPEHIYQTQCHNPAAAMSTLYPCIVYGNKYRPAPPEAYNFYIHGVEQLVGIVPKYFADELFWNPRFSFHEDSGTEDGDNIVGKITLRTEPTRNDDAQLPCVEDVPKCCETAFEELIADNSAKFPSFAKWLNTPFEEREYSLIHLCDDENPGRIRIPCFLKGFLGILTVGVHLNVFSRDYNTGEFSIWVSQRARGRDVAYPGMLDQIVAGGVDIDDEIEGYLAPSKTLIREAREETGLSIDWETRTVATPGTPTVPKIDLGKVQRVSNITFFDKKDWKAGNLNKDHLEPGLRIIYDLEIKEPKKFHPQGIEEGIEKLECMNVSEVKKSLLANKWKPNCGLVMLDFLLRRNIINADNDASFSRMLQDLRPEMPMRFAEKYQRNIRGW